MQLCPELINNWPKLAWVCAVAKESGHLHLYHGPCVEIADTFIAEAVWAGDFSAGDFDQTELIFGSGIRCYKDRAVFVSPGVMLDGLWWCEKEGQFYVSNSLPALLARAELSLRDDYSGYVADIHTLMAGLGQYRQEIPAEPVNVRLARFHNLLYDGTSIRVIDKPDTAPDFENYNEYAAFLMQRARQLGENISDHLRKHRITPMVGISSGYDSGAAAVIARQAGCTDAVTIVNSSSMFSRSDSGAEIARCLGLKCREYVHRQNLYQNEVAVWAAAGNPAGLNLTIFDYPEPLSVFFSGYCGDTTWCREYRDRTEPFSAPSIAGLSFCEFRLWRGLFHSVVPFWGSRHIRQIEKISFSPDMEPWTLNKGKYDRPIPRRLLEEAGVPRTLFGMRKEVTSVENFFLWPFLPESRNSFADFLRRRGMYAPSAGSLWLLRKLAHWDQLLTVNINHALGCRLKGLRPHMQLQGQSFFFHWANAELKSRYQIAMKESLPPADGRKTGHGV